MIAIPEISECTATDPTASEVLSPGARDSRPGKGSKWNSLQFGLTAKQLFPADLAAEVARFTALVTEYYQPGSAFEVELVAKMGRAGAQLNDCEKRKRINQQRVRDRAATATVWDSDRRGCTAELGAKLSRDPARISQLMAQTKHGADWLLDRWHKLDDILVSNGTWNEGQRAFAFDLLGIEPVLREGSRQIPAGADTATLRALVAREVERLERLQEATLVTLDEVEQSMVIAGFQGEEDAWTRRLRRYEASASLEYRRARAELLDGRARATAALAENEGARPGRPARLSSRRPRPEPNSRFMARQALLRQFTEFDQPAAAGEGGTTPFPFNRSAMMTAAVPTPAAVPTRTVAPIPAAAGVAAKPAAVMPQTAPVREGQRRDDDAERRKRRAREKAARKAGRRRS